MKMISWLLPGAAGRIQKDMQQGEHCAVSLASEIASKVQSEIAALQARIAELERNPADQYKGVFRRDLEYRRGETTSHKGSMWLALADNNDTPGASSAWRLVAKGDKPQ